MANEKGRIDAYLDTISRIEPDITMIDRDAALASIAISLKRLADQGDKKLEILQRQQSLNSTHPDMWMGGQNPA